MNRKHDAITESILGCCFEVINELGSGFLESVYERALTLALLEKGHKVSAQHALPVHFRGHIVGNFIADLIVDECVVIEMKATKFLAPEHKAQVINYLKATGIEVGLLVNFGNPRLEYRRLTRDKEFVDRNSGSIGR